MSLHASEIAAVVAELAPLVGARVDAVRLHSERSLTIDVFGRARKATLLISAEPDLTRVHAVERRPSARPNAPALQAVLRRELEGSTLAGLAARAGDRVVELDFERGGRRLRLVAELTGRHGNLFVVDERGLIVACARRGGSGQRDVAPGKPYLAPPARGEPEAGPRFVAVASRRFPLSAAIDEHYRGLELQRALEEGRRRLREPIRAALARSRRALDRLAEELARVPAAEENRRRADLLKQNLHRIRRGARQAVVTEWTERGAGEVAVPLDPALGARENMERYYRRYRRIVESAARVQARMDEVRSRTGALEALLAEIDRAGVGELPRLEREARRLCAAPRPRPRPRPTSRRDEPLPPYRSFRSISGVPLLVGRNAEANDALTVTVARGNDLWLHARGRAGAHVVARLDKGRQPDGETLLDGAHLAAHFSDARGDPQVEVVATRAKYVRKVKGTAPGAVTYSQERTIQVRVEPGRVERLLASEED